MAYTKVFAIRSRLDKTVAYAANEKKTSLSGIIEYAVNPRKTEQRMFETALNCESPETAFSEMSSTKERWRKEGGVLGYHFIQSFAPGEVTPEKAHALGVAFAKELFGDRFECVIGTHLDKEHLHSHIVINSVSFVDGKKYHSSPENYYNCVRVTSDRLCSDNNLSVITSNGKGKNYAEWSAERSRMPTIRAMIRKDVDEMLSEAFTYKSFLDLMRKRGYTIRTSPNTAHTAVRPPDGNRFIRLDSLGEGYTEREIKVRLQTERMKPHTTLLQLQPRRRSGRYRGLGRPRHVTGFRALYFRYLYLLRRVPYRSTRNKTPFPIRQEVLKLERYNRQFRFLLEYRVDTKADLAMLTDAMQAETDALTARRRKLYDERKNGSNTASGQIQTINTRLRSLRQQQRICRSIQTDATHIRNMIGLSGRELYTNRSHIHEETHQTRSTNPFGTHSSIPSGGGRGY